MMHLSIRTKLTLTIALVYASVFFLLLLAGAASLYIGLQDQMDSQLKESRNIIIELYETEYQSLPAANSDEGDQLVNDLRGDLKEIHGHEYQYVALIVNKESEPLIIEEGRIENSVFRQGENFQLQKTGLYNRRLQNRLYRFLVTALPWGTIVIAEEYHLLFEIAEEFREILLVGLPLTLALVLFGGYFLAGRAMRPVARTAEAAEKITMTNLSERLPGYRGKDEFGQLVTTLNYMIDRLEGGIKKVQQFSQDAAHELRTPLTIMRGELELAYQNQDNSDETQAVLQRSLDHAISMSKIVEDLMLLASSDTGDYPIQKSTFRIDSLLKDIIDDLNVLVNEKPIEIKLPHCDEVTFKGDRQLIQRLLFNLADNAAKHTEHGFIEFQLHKSERLIDITIEDSGEGIPESDLPHIFDRFYRVDKARAGGGSGLGLSICKWIVELHHGTITMQSQPEEGATVHITFPVHNLS